MKEASIRKLACFGISLIAAWWFIHQGWMKTPWHKGGGEYADKFADWGLSPDLLLPIGLAEIVAGLLILFPRSTSVGGAVGLVLMLGAVYIHISTGVGKSWDAVVLAVICLTLIILRWPESILNRSRED